MTARSRMILRALVERFASPGDDDFGNPLPGSWSTHISALPIWVHGSTEREAVTEETTAVVTDLKALIPLGSDVTESDRLNQVKDRQGNVVYAGILGIETVLFARTHLELTLSRVAS